jgi:hypothetical protein
MEINENKLKSILTEQRDEYQRLAEKERREFQQHVDTRMDK